MTNDRILVVRKKSRRHGSSHHGGAWKIAYADFVTAMMSFFLVMWLLSIVPKNELQGIADYFRTPLITAMKGERMTPSTPSIIPGGDPSPIKQTQPKEPGLDPFAEQDRVDERNLENLRQKLENLIENNPTLKLFRPQLILDMTPEGLRIQIVDNQNKPMFSMGSASMLDHMKLILSELSPAINSLPNGISISGHTDSVQYATGETYYSNWELSSDRANNARQRLVASGYDSNKIRRVQGLSSIVNIDADPLSPQNRRISIVIMNKRAERALFALGTQGSTSISSQPAPVVQVPGNMISEIESLNPLSSKEKEALMGPAHSAGDVVEDLAPGAQTWTHDATEVQSEDISNESAAEANGAAQRPVPAVAKKTAKKSVAKDKP